MSKLNPTLTTLELDHEGRAVVVKAGKLQVRLSIKNGHLAPDSRDFMNADLKSDDSLGLRLAMTALIVPITFWVQDPTEKNEKELRELHQAFNEAMEASPEHATMLAIENGLGVLKEVLRKQGPKKEVVLMPTNVELVTHLEQRAVKIACGEAFVVLCEVPSSEPGSKAIDAVEEVGDYKSEEHANMKLTFMAIREQVEVYLTGDDDEAEKLGPQMLAAAEGWNTVKEEQPDMAKSLIGPLMEGAVRLNAMSVTVDSEQADALIKRYEAGEMSVDDLHKALGDNSAGPVH